METTPLTQQLLKQFMTKAYENAKAKGFYKPDLDINQALMLIITEMGEAIQASRHDRHGSIEDYNKWLGVSEEQAYEESLEGTVESEFADVALRIMSLLDYIESLPYKVGDKVSCSRCDVCWIASIVPERGYKGYTGEIDVRINPAKKDGTRSNREFVLWSMEIDSIKKID